VPTLPSTDGDSGSRVLTLRIEEQAAPIQGSIDDEAGASREFCGWLGLARALELTLEPAKSRSGTPAPTDRR
jgi:hypothetical protein